MKTLLLLLWKDARRSWRNPLGWLIFLAVPMVITGLIGVTFGPSSQTGGLGRIRFALVDQDDSPLTRFLRGALGQRESMTNLEAVAMSAPEALGQIRDNKLSAMIVIPAGFTRSYLTTTNAVTFELVKNPAESIHPAVLEELMGALVTALDTLKRHLAPEMPRWQALFDGHGDYHQVAELIVRAGDQIESARKMLSPLRVTYVRQTITSDEPASVAQTNTPPETQTNLSASAPGTTDKPPPASAPSAKKPAKPEFNLFGYLLPGMAAMFLLFLAENANRDIQRERRQRTLDRFRTLHDRLYSFVASKVIFCLVFLLVCSAVMLGVGGLIFKIHWRDPLAVAGLTTGYCAFTAGLMSLLPALVREARTAQVLSNVFASMIGLAGGSAFPAEQLPRVLREHVCPWMPNYWYTQAVHSVLFDPTPGAWLPVALKSVLVGAVLMAVAAALLRRGLERGAG